MPAPGAGFCDSERRHRCRVRVVVARSLWQKRVSISAAVKDPGKPMPGITTLIHALLQIITVAMGSPLGREVAPREVGSLFAGGVARYLRLTLPIFN
jgi:hypothetical protein